MEKNLTRRGFLKNLGVASTGAVGLGLGLSGCAPAAPKSELGATGTEDATQEASPTQVPAQEDPIWSLGEVAEPSDTKDAQVLIIGGGGTGLACALQAVELGLKPLVVEQFSSYGGSFVGTEFIFAPENKYQKTCGTPEAENDTVFEAINDHMNYHHWYPNHALVADYFNQAAKTIEWLEGYGIEFDMLAGYRLRALAYKHGDDGLSIGARFINTLAKHADEKGVEALFGMRARKLLVENGKAVGALVENEKGEVTQVNADAVVVCTGGYANNEEFLHSVSQVTNSTHTIGMSCRNADGLKMIKDAGGKMAEGIGCIMWGGGVIKDAVDAEWQTPVYAVGTQPVLWVNQDGKRFAREDLWLDNFSGTGVNFRNQQKTYMIFGEDVINRFETEGSYIQVFTVATPGVPMTGIKASLEALDAVHIADTLEEAAGLAGLDPASLRETVDTYNAQCAGAVGLDPEDTSADPDFGKRAQFMIPVNQGPYYICEASAVIYTTCGGAKINGNLEVLQEDDTPIEGLYAGGMDAGCVQGDSYDVVYCGGSAVGWAINSGRLAAQHIADYLS